jgi:hypothetical protein
MTRTTIHYDGEEYVVARRAADLKGEIDEILATGTPGWLRVNHGRGQLQVAELLITPGTPIGLIDTSDPDNTQHLD